MVQLRIDGLTENVFETPLITISKGFIDYDIDSGRSMERDKILQEDERNERVNLSSFKNQNPSIPESSRIKSQFKVMRGNINRSHTFMGNKFVNSEVKPRRQPTLKTKYLELLHEDVTGKEGEIQDVIQSEKDYKTFKMYSLRSNTLGNLS